MDTSLGRALTTLPKGTLLPVPQPHGKGVAVFHGRAWLTQQDDPRDVLLSAGESFALDRPGVAIVQALDDTSLLIFETHPGGAEAAHHLETALPARLDPPQATRADVGALQLQARHWRTAAVAAAGVVTAARAATARALRTLGRRWTSRWARA